MPQEYPLEYQRANLVACPIHGFIRITKPDDYGKTSDESTEFELIDHPWLQRLRRIHQLQAAWWVFPSGEHTRLQHALGSMYLGGTFVEHLYSSLRQSCGDTPSKALVVETARIAGLLHDIGHGPFSHFFDTCYLAGASSGQRTHEDISCDIIDSELAVLIKNIKRSPSGDFENGEQIQPENLKHLIKKGSEPTKDTPEWVKKLRPLFQGPYTVDNMDFVLRDSYMCGRPAPQADVERLIHYSFIHPDEGLVLHLHGLSSLATILQTRLLLFSDIYYHRTVRAIEVHLREVFEETIRKFWGDIGPVQTPAELKMYLEFVDEWQLMAHVLSMIRKDPGSSLSHEWKRIIDRDPEWKRVYEFVCTEGHHRGSVDPTEEDCERRLAAKDLAKLCRPDIAQVDPVQLKESIKVWNPMIGKIDPTAAARISEMLPERWRVIRIYSKDRSTASKVHELMNSYLFPSNWKEPVNI